MVIGQVRKLVVSKNRSILDTTNLKDSVTWKVTKIPEISQAEKDKIRKKLPKY